MQTGTDFLAAKYTNLGSKNSQLGLLRRRRSDKKPLEEWLSSQGQQNLLVFFQVINNPSWITIAGEYRIVNGDNFSILGDDGQSFQ